MATALCSSAERYSTLARAPPRPAPPGPLDRVEGCRPLVLSTMWALDPQKCILDLKITLSSYDVFCVPLKGRCGATLADPLPRRWRFFAVARQLPARKKKSPPHPKILARIDPLFRSAELSTPILGEEPL